MDVRTATLEDAAMVATLLGELRQSLVTPESIADSLAKILADTDRTALLITDEARPLGMAIINIVHKLPKKEVRIDEVVVSQTARGRGLGTVLIQACETWASEHDADVIEFTSRASREAANHLYQKLGYQIRDTNVYHKDKGDF